MINIISFLKQPEILQIMEKINFVWLSLSGWILGLMYIPQIIQLFKEKDHKLVDMRSTLPLTFSILGFTFNGIVIYIITGNPGTFLSQTKSLVPIALMYIMYFYYKIKNKPRQ